MKEVEVNAFEVEKLPTPVATLDEATRDKLVKLPKPIVAQIRTDITSTHMAQMVILDQIDPRGLKLKPENKDDYCIHSCEHCSTLMKIPWKVNSSVKKGNHGGSCHTEHDMMLLKNNCAEEGHNSVKYSLKDVGLK